jgi:hypothetical protein
MERKISLLGAINRFDSNGNNTNSPNGGNITENDSSSTNGTNNGSSNHRKNRIMFALLFISSVLVTSIFVTLALFQLDYLQEFQAF